MNGSSLDFRLLAYIGNGHVATVVYSDFIFMNGLYNGANGLYIIFLLSQIDDSRVRIPLDVATNTANFHRFYNGL
jgi:hypothetical protein